MKTHRNLSLLMILLSFCAIAQTEITKHRILPERELTIEPGVGIHTNFGTDVLVANLIQWNLTRHLSLAAHSSYHINNVFQRDFNFIKTEYNYSLNHKFGIGKTAYTKRSSHSIFFMAGAKYTAYKEILNNPDLDKASSTVGAWSPDYGMMYGAEKRGWKSVLQFSSVHPPLSLAGEGFEHQLH